MSKDVMIAALQNRMSNAILFVYFCKKNSVFFVLRIQIFFFAWLQCGCTPLLKGS